MKKLLLAAAVLTLATPAFAIPPYVCGQDAWGRIVCIAAPVNPSAKIIHVEPFDREPAPVAQPLPPIEPEVIPLPRPRPPGLGAAPIDRPRQVIQQ